MFPMYALLIICISKTSATIFGNWKNITDYRTIQFVLNANTFLELVRAVEDDYGLMVNVDVSASLPASTASAVVSKEYNGTGNTLDQWLFIFKNKNLKQKGVKFHFRNPNSYHLVRYILTSEQDTLRTVPVILHADIVPSQKINVTDMNARHFIKAFWRLQINVYYSFGWNSVWDKSLNRREHGYTWTDVLAMYDVLKTNDLLTHPRIIFSVRAFLCNSESLQPLLWLMNTVPQSILSMWSTDDLEELDYGQYHINLYMRKIPKTRLLLEVPGFYYSYFLNFTDYQPRCLSLTDPSYTCFNPTKAYNISLHVLPAVMSKFDEPIRINLGSFDNYSSLIFNGNLEKFEFGSSVISLNSDSPRREICSFSMKRSKYNLIKLKCGDKLERKYFYGCHACYLLAFKFYYKINVSTQTLHVSVSRIPGSIHGKYRAKYYSEPDLKFEHKLELGNLNDLFLEIGTTSKTGVVFHEMQAFKTPRDPENPPVSSALGQGRSPQGIIQLSPGIRVIVYDHPSEKE